MEIATSILSIKEGLEEKVLSLKDTDTSYIHLDIMDGKFVPNKTSFIEIGKELIETNKKLDIHFMVERVDEYIEVYKKLNPAYITFHIESEFNEETIKKIKQISKVGLAINPKTKIEALLPYIDKVDMILLMSVEPGYGGQSFIMETISRLQELKNLQKEYDFKIEIDGGINEETIKYVKEADIIVSGSYITNSQNFNERIKNLLK